MGAYPVGADGAYPVGGAGTYPVGPRGCCATAGLAAAHGVVASAGNAVVDGMAVAACATNGLYDTPVFQSASHNHVNKPAGCLQSCVLKNSSHCQTKFKNVRKNRNCENEHNECGNSRLSGLPG